MKWEVLFRQTRVEVEAKTEQEAFKAAQRDLSKGKVQFIISAKRAIKRKVKPHNQLTEKSKKPKKGEVWHWRLRYWDVGETVPFVWPGGEKGRGKIIAIKKNWFGRVSYYCNRDGGRLLFLENIVKGLKDSRLVTQ